MGADFVGEVYKRTSNFILLISLLLYASCVVRFIGSSKVVCRTKSNESIKLLRKFDGNQYS